MAVLSTNTPADFSAPTLLRTFMAAFVPLTTLKPALAVMDLSDDDLAQRGIKRSDVAREIMCNGSWT